MTPATLYGMGLPVIPATARKKPAVGWMQFQARVPTQAEFDSWTRQRFPVWGIVTGKISGRVVLDFDGEEGRRTLERLGLKPHVMTPSGGAHVHVAHPGFSVKTENHNSSRQKPWSQEWPGTDIRGDGGFEACLGATEKGSYSIVRDLMDLDLWAALPAAFRRHFEPRPTTVNLDDELVRRALELASSSGRNEGGLWLACQCRDNGRSEATADAVMVQYNRSVGPYNRKGEAEAYTLEEARNSLSSAYARAAREPWGSRPSVAPMPTTAARPLHTYPFTDSGNAERFAARCRGDFHYSAPERTWYHWTGSHWTPDKAGRVMQAAKTVVREMYAAAGHLEDAQARTKTAEWARKCESLDRIRAMLTLAQSEGDIPIDPNAWNQDGWLLNCENGTVDLRTGELLPHRRGDLITRLAPTAYDHTSQHDLWTRFLETSTAGDGKLLDFLQRAAGYSATGDTREEKLFMVLGPTCSGKSTFLEALKAALGDYSRVADFETFVQKRDAGVRNDIAALAGRRLVVSIEVEEGKRLAEGLVKSLTGRDTIAARFLHQEFFEFKPQFKLWLAANDAPKVRHADEAIWRRILRVPFEHTVPASQCDPTLKDRLCESPECRHAVLAWIVQGALQWAENGLQEPERVKQATAAYRETQNPLRDFIDDCCRLEPDALISASELRRAYENWAGDAGFTALLNPNRFADALAALGCESTRLHSGRHWLGIELKKAGSVTP